MLKPYQEIRTPQREPGREQSLFTFQGTQLIWLFLALLESLFALRLLLGLIAGSHAGPFGALLYSFTGVFLLPFAGITGTLAAGDMVLEVSTVVAMVAYALLGWVLQRAVWVIFYRPYAPAAVLHTIITDRHTP